MSFLPSLPQDAKLLHLFQAYPAASKPLLQYHEVVMRGPSAFSAAEREAIAAFVSRQNACAYCAGVHGATATAMGYDKGALACLLDDDADAVAAKLRPVLAYVRKLTARPSSVTAADAQAMRDAGWPEAALHDAAAICGLYNLMNRLVEGLGIRGDDAYFAAAGARLSAKGYAAMIAALGPG